MPIPTPNPEKEVARHAAFHSALRQPSADERRLLIEALEAGATITGRKWMAYFGGETDELPIQFEGAYLGAESRDEWAREIVSANIARRDAYLARVQSGDLAGAAYRVSVGRIQKAA